MSYLGNLYTTKVDFPDYKLFSSLWRGTMEPFVHTSFWFAESHEECGLCGLSLQHSGSHSSNLPPETPQHLKEKRKKKLINRKKVRRQKEG